MILPLKAIGEAISKDFSDTSVGIIAASVAIYTATIAFNDGASDIYAATIAFIAGASDNEVTILSDDHCYQWPYYL